MSTERIIEQKTLQDRQDDLACRVDDGKYPAEIWKLTDRTARAATMVAFDRMMNPEGQPGADAGIDIIEAEVPGKGIRTRLMVREVINQYTQEYEDIAIWPKALFMAMGLDKKISDYDGMEPADLEKHLERIVIDRGNGEKFRPFERLKVRTRYQFSDEELALAEEVGQFGANGQRIGDVPERDHHGSYRSARAKSGKYHSEQLKRERDQRIREYEGHNYDDMSVAERNRWAKENLDPKKRKAHKLEDDRVVYRPLNRHDHHDVPDTTNGEKAYSPSAPNARSVRREMKANQLEQEANSRSFEDWQRISRDDQKERSITATMTASRPAITEARMAVVQARALEQKPVKAPTEIAPEAGESKQISTTDRMKAFILARVGELYDWRGDGAVEWVEKLDKDQLASQYWRFMTPLEAMSRWDDPDFVRTLGARNPRVYALIRTRQRNEQLMAGQFDTVPVIGAIVHPAHQSRPRSNMQTDFAMAARNMGSNGPRRGPARSSLG